MKSLNAEYCDAMIRVVPRLQTDFHYGMQDEFGTGHLSVFCFSSHVKLATSQSVALHVIVLSFD